MLGFNNAQEGNGETMAGALDASGFLFYFFLFLDLRITSHLRPPSPLHSHH
jgi:hypothetical protein